MADLQHQVAPQTFGIVNFVVFGLSMVSGAFVGIYFACSGSKEGNQESDFLVGGRSMKVFPIALSLVASYISGITLLGLPAEVSVYGCQVMYGVVLMGLSSYVYTTQILPVFHSLQGLSLNEYFVHRFDKKVRILASILYVIATMGWLPIVIYVPALAYEQVTGYNVHFVTPVVSLVCIFYTSIGGIKAVVWTDVIQMVSMLLCVILVVIKGTYDVGGFSTVWERNIASERLEPPFVHFDPSVRHSIFGIVLGGIINQLAGGCLNQGMVQRHQTLPTLNEAKRAVWQFTILVAITVWLSGYSGLVIAANYFDCDPFSIKLIRTKDQIVPLFVIQSLTSIPGLVGLFVAGIFSAALSSMSTALNTMSAVFLEDWVRGCNIWNPTDRQASWTMKVFVVLMGVVTVALVSVVEKLGMVVQMSSSIASLSTGPMVTLFLSGLFLPWVSTKGALMGAAAAALSVAPIIFTTQFYVSQGLIRYPAKQISLEGCSRRYNVSQEWVNNFKVLDETSWPMGPARGDVAYPFRLSYLWYTPISVTCGLAVAIFASLFISRNDLKRVDRRLIVPFARRWLPKSAADSMDRGKHVVITDLEKTDLSLQL